MLMDMCLPKFDIYQSTVAPNCFKSQQTLDVLLSFKTVLFDVRTEIHFVRLNIVSTEQSVRA